MVFTRYNALNINRTQVYKWTSFNYQHSEQYEKCINGGER